MFAPLGGRPLVDRSSTPPRRPGSARSSSSSARPLRGGGRRPTCGAPASSATRAPRTACRARSGSGSARLGAGRRRRARPARRPAARPPRRHRAPCSARTCPPVARSSSRAMPAAAAQNPALVLRRGWPLADGLTGDRGFGPLIAAHPELVVEVAGRRLEPRRRHAGRPGPGRLGRPGPGQPGAGRPGPRGRRRRLLRGHDRPVPGRSAPAGRRRRDPGRPPRPRPPGRDAGSTSAPAPAATRCRSRSRSRPVARSSRSRPRRACSAPCARSSSTHGIGNVRIVEGRWPLGAGILPAPAADVALIANVGYDIETIGAVRRRDGGRRPAACAWRS